MSDILAEAENKISLHEYESAEKIYRNYLEKNPSDDKVWNSLGIVLQKEKKFYEASDAFGTASDLDTNNSVYYFNLGNVLAEIHRYAEAKAVFEKAAEISDDIRYQFKVGDMLGFLGQYDKALLLYSLLLTKYQDNPGLYRRMTVVQNHLGRTADALVSAGKEMEVRQKLIETEPNAMNWYKYADLKARLSLWDEAKIGLEKSLEFEESADTHMRLGAVLVMLKMHEEADAEFEKAASFDPRDFDFLMTLADRLCSIAQYESAIKYYTRALELRSVHADAWVGIAYALMKTERVEEAKAFFEMAKASSAVRELQWADKLHKSDKTDALDKGLS